jgi:hypothetical protein
MSEIIIQYECSLILAVEYQKNKFLKGNYKLKRFMVGEEEELLLVIE